jgi:hypothetical protein
VDIGGGRVGEFVTLEVAAVLGVSDPAASALVDDVAGLRSRHPLMWAAVQELKLEVWQARKVVRTCHELSLDAVLAVDRKLASGWGVLPVVEDLQETAQSDRRRRHRAGQGEGPGRPR